MKNIFAIDLINADKLLNMSLAFFLLIFGYFFAKRLSIIAEHSMAKRFSRHHTMLVRRTIFYFIFTVFCVTGLQHLGFKLSVLLGAAGVFTVAISFASQTAISNLISGIFLLFEHPFKVGDTIEIKGISGVVDSIDLLSTKLKTADNKLVRIPNEAMIKSEISNLSYFTTRRIDIIVSIAYDCDLAQVKAILINIANQCPLVLNDPAPSVSVDSFANASLELKFMVWVKTADTTTTRNLLQEQIKQRFDLEGIASPQPQVTLNRV